MLNYVYKLIKKCFVKFIRYLSEQKILFFVRKMKIQIKEERMHSAKSSIKF